MSQVVSARVEDSLKEWLDGYALERGVKLQALVNTALVSFRKDCEAGVPEIRARAREQAYGARAQKRGVGECPKSEVGHVWVSVDGVRVCEFCSKPGREFLSEFGAARAELFAGLKAPMTSGGRGKAEK